MKYFVNIDLSDIKAIRTLFHKLCLKLHPDKGGNRYEFEAMYAEYKLILGNIETGNYEEQKTSQEQESFLSEIISQLMPLHGLTVDLVGTWLWVTGNTYSHRETLKSLGFKWSKSKSAWYFGGSKSGKVRGKFHSMQEVYDKFGRTIIKDDPAPAGSFA